MRGFRIYLCSITASKWYSLQFWPLSPQTLKTLRERACVCCVCVCGGNAPRKRRRKKEREKEICNLYIKRTEKARQGEKWRRSWEGASWITSSSPLSYLISFHLQENHPYAREIRISVRIRPRLCFCWLKIFNKFWKPDRSPHGRYLSSLVF